MVEYSHQTIEYHFGDWACWYNDRGCESEGEVMEATWLTIVNHFDGDVPSVPFTKLREPNIRLGEVGCT